MTMLRRTGALLVAALPATASAASWTRGTGAVSVTVDSGTFAYSVALSDRLQDDAIADAATCGGFEGGGIEFRCDGVLYTHGGTASAGTALKLAAAPAESTGADRLGSFDSISASFEGGSSAACALFAEIRYYSTTDSFVFAADFAPQPVPRVNSTELFTDGTDCPRCPQGSGKKCNGYCVEDMPGLATAFPTWPQGGAASECEYYSYAGNSLGGNWRAGLLSTWSGGMEAGPLLLYPAGSSAFHPPAMVLSPLTHAKAMIGSPGDKAAPTVSFGVQGYVEALPPSFDQAVLLVGRQGISAAQMAWGETLRRHAGTRRLTLDEDILNSKIHYLTDNGAYYCYCNTFPQTPDRRVPMHITIKALKAYHKKLGAKNDSFCPLLNEKRIILPRQAREKHGREITQKRETRFSGLHIDLYHLDSGFWHSAHADGHCDGKRSIFIFYLLHYTSATYSYMPSARCSPEQNTDSLSNN